MSDALDTVALGFVMLAGLLAGLASVVPCVLAVLLAFGLHTAARRARGS